MELGEEGYGPAVRGDQIRERKRDHVYKEWRREPCRQRTKPRRPDEPEGGTTEVNTRPHREGPDADKQAIPEEGVDDTGAEDARSNMWMEDIGN